MGRRNRPSRGPSRYKRGNHPRGHIPEMRVSLPHFSFQVGRDRTVTWSGTLQPNPSSDCYRIRVVYQRQGYPRVYVVDPALQPNAPHRWPDGSLCLFWPKEWRWSDSESIPSTIIAWAALWLEHYEVWKALKVWLGPSSHEEFPTEDEEDDDA